MTMIPKLRYVRRGKEQVLQYALVPVLLKNNPGNNRVFIAEQKELVWVDVQLEEITLEQPR